MAKYFIEIKLHLGISLQSELIIRAILSRAGELEPEAVEPSIFSGAKVGAGTFLNISLEPEQQKFYWLQLESWSWQILIKTCFSYHGDSMHKV